MKSQASSSRVAESPGARAASITAADPASYVKRTHWAWYVWPTAKVGFSDPEETAVTTLTDVEAVLLAARR